MTIRIHATTVSIKGCGVMIMGGSGSGKSDLGLRLIDRGAMLVSDDYTEITANSGVLIASSPSTIAGKLEVRGLGIVTQPFKDNVSVKLIVDLDQVPQRLPDVAQHREILGILIATLALAAHEASSPIKVEWALNQVACQ